MSDLPDDFTCRVTDWEYVYARCRDVADEVRAAPFDPDVVVALARGGWFAGRCLCDFIGLDDLVSLKVEHYVGTATQTDEPQVRYPLYEGSVADKDVLIVDDIADTGQSIRRARQRVSAHDPNEVRTATLQMLDTSSVDPDFVGERLDEWAWMVYPWNFIEDMSHLVSGILEDADDPLDRATIRRRLADRHDIGHIELEVAQPDRFDEVLAEMERRGAVEPVDGDAWRLA
jgi:hypoxanthine phosphoribosyltransferase